jgi:hypothetical protein
MSNYLFDLIAKTGNSVASGGSLSGFETTPSINDSGLVAFVGKFGSPEDLLVGDGELLLNNLSSSYSGTFRSGVEINNDNEVVAVDLSGSFSAIRLWDVNNPGSFSKTLGTGKYPPDFVDFENIFSFPELNNNFSTDQVVFTATPKNQFPNVGLETFAGGGFGGRTYNQIILTNGTSRPAIADNGTVAIKDLGEKIVLYNYQLNLTDVIASSFNGFSSVGTSPGISNDGKTIVFYGNLTNPGADSTTQGLNPGAGIFVSIETDTGREIKRIAGIASNGILDPGETHEDTNENGAVDLGEDKGDIFSFASNEKIGIIFKETLGETQTPNGGFGDVAFLALDNSGKIGLFSNQFKISSTEGTTQTTVSSSLVAKAGQEANRVSPELTGSIQNINIYDPINDSGQIAFWVKTTNSEEAVVRANPVRKPVLIVPGIGGSFPISNFKDWILDRGVSPDTLQPEQYGRIYNDLIETLKRSGYVEGINLFVATYDWRLNPGPIDEVLDGKIHRSVAELTDNTYEYSVDQFAFWLKEAVKGWRRQFSGIPSNLIPGLDSVDIIAHSAGGLPVRTYIQNEDAYGKSFTFIDDDGNTLDANLPKVNNFISLGVPYRGSAIPWQALQNNFSYDPVMRLLGQILRIAFRNVNQGTTIKLTGHTDAEGAITQEEATALGPLGFIEEYVPNLKALLATYPFIDDSSDQLKTSKEIDSTTENTFLLDLNNGFDSIPSRDPNGFANLIQQMIAIYATGTPTPDGVIQKIGPEYLVNTNGINVLPKPTILPFNNKLLPRSPREGEIWYELKEKLVDTQGDQAIPRLSAIGTFEEYPKANINLINFPSVIHTSLTFDPDIQKRILEILGVRLEDELISTNLHTSITNLSGLSGDLTPLISTIILDPVEGFIVDGQGRRLGYTTATGAITEIPNSVWLGETDGIGFIPDLVEGPIQLQLTGLSEDYYVSVALETEDGPAAIEKSGFLAAGE